MPHDEEVHPNPWQGGQGHIYPNLMALGVLQESKEITEGGAQQTEEGVFPSPS